MQLITLNQMEGGPYRDNVHLSTGLIRLNCIRSHPCRSSALPTEEFTQSNSIELHVVSIEVTHDCLL